MQYREDQRHAVWAIKNGRAGVRVDITLGMPKYDCRFHGICRLDIQEDDLQPSPLPICGQVRGWLLLPHPAYCLICFDHRTMTAACREFHFARPDFVLHQGIAGSSALVRHLECPLVLQPGRYRINEHGQYYSVLFRMQG